MDSLGAMGTVTLPTVVPAPEGKPLRSETDETQSRSRRIAQDPAYWNEQEAAAIAARFDLLAEIWDEERSSYRSAPLADALARGGPLPKGTCVELGSGTGVLTPLLLEHWPITFCVDLSAGMLRKARSGIRLRADSCRLPLRSGSAAVVVLGDTSLFAQEVVRLLHRDGVVIWLNALGADAPHFVPTEVLLAAFERASARRWDAVQSQALWGQWVVLRRQ